MLKRITIFSPSRKPSRVNIALKRLQREYGSTIEFDIYYPKDNSFISKFYFYFLAGSSIKSSDSIYIFNTILLFPAFLFCRRRNKYLYMQEVELEGYKWSKWVFRWINKLISSRKKIVVNKLIDPKSIFMPISSSLENYNGQVDWSKREFDFCLVNYYQGKDCSRFFELASLTLNRSFLLISDVDKSTENELKTKNVSVVPLDQKTKYLLKVKFLLSLSVIDEAFNLELLEGLEAGCYPLSPMNLSFKLIWRNFDLNPIDCDDIVMLSDRLSLLEIDTIELAAKRNEVLEYLSTSLKVGITKL